MPLSYNRKLGIFYMHHHIDMIMHGTAFSESVSSLVEQVDKIMVELHLSETCRLCQAQTWIAHVTDRDVTHCAISLPLSLKK